MKVELGLPLFYISIPAQNHEIFAVAITKVNLTTFMCRLSWNLETSTPGTHRAAQACTGIALAL
jgi:hypothetical protein